MSTVTKEAPVSAPAKPVGGLKKRLSALGRVWAPLKKRLSGLGRLFTPVKKRLAGLRGVLPALKKRLPALRGLFPALKKRLAALRGALPILARFPRAHLTFLGKLPAWRFVPLAGLWTVLLKTALVPIAGLLTVLSFRPLGIARLFDASPVLSLGDLLTRWLYEASFLSLGWTPLLTVSQLALAGILFPVACTLLAQLVPLELLARSLPSRRWRISISLAVMGILYLLGWGESALLVTGAVIGIPLTWTFLHWRRRGSVARACLVTGGVHAVANAVVILFLCFFGGV